MAEQHGQPHSDECSHATGNICICSCRGAFHGVALHGGHAPHLVRMREVNVTASTDSPDGPTTPAGRRARPVTVVEVHHDTPVTHPDPDVPTVTHTDGRDAPDTPPLPGDLSGLSDDDLMNHFTVLSEQGHDHDVQRIWDEMGRREEAAAARARSVEAQRVKVPADLRFESKHRLDDLLAHVTEHGTDAEIQHVYGEMVRREEKAAAEADALAKAARHAADQAAAEAGWADPPDLVGGGSPTQWAELTPEQDQKLESMLARGYDYFEAYAAVHDIDPDKLRAEQAGATVGRRPGETTARAARRQYDEWVHLQYVEAETAVRGHVLSKAGKAAGVDPVALFSGPTATARKYASEDLLRWWAEPGHRRMTFAEFKAETLGGRADKAAAKVTALVAQGKDFA